MHATSLYIQQRKSPEFWNTKWSKEGTWFHSFAKNQSLQTAVFDICVSKQCRQKLGIILWSYVNCEKFFSDKEIRKIRIFFDIDDWLWSPNFMIFVPNLVNINNNSLFSLVNLSLSSQNLHKSKQVSWLYENKETFKQE